MKHPITYIDAGIQDTGRPKERPPKTTRTMEVVKRLLKGLQHIAPSTTAAVIWYYFGRPGQTRFTPAQVELMNRANRSKFEYHGHEITTYTWGNSGPRVLLAHGWRSKSVDFRRMIEQLLTAGFVVEAIDMKAHGKSTGVSSGLPEFRDLIKQYYVQHGPFHAVIGYSLGGLAAGLVMGELSKAFHPKHLVILASPPYMRYFFADVIQKLGFKKQVFERFSERVEKIYGEDIDLFDLRRYKQYLRDLDIHLIYDQQDETIAFAKGKELELVFPNAHFVQTSGLGHYKIITYPEVITYIRNAIAVTSEIETIK